MLGLPHADPALRGKLRGQPARSSPSSLRMTTRRPRRRPMACRARCAIRSAREAGHARELQRRIRDASQRRTERAGVRTVRHRAGADTIMQTRRAAASSPKRLSISRIGVVRDLPYAVSPRRWGRAGRIVGELPSRCRIRSGCIATTGQAKLPGLSHAGGERAGCGSPRAGRAAGRLKRHVFVAANFFMQRMLNRYRDDLDVGAAGGIDGTRPIAR